MSINYRAILLLGPTGSGKTPLGEALEKRSIRGHRVAHFDFGAHLRSAVAQPTEYAHLTTDEIELFKRKLKENTLLEDDEFYIAERILASFIDKKRIAENDFIILNSLPRHVGQATSVGAIVTVEEIIYLECSENVVRHRIAADEGGDRGFRIDDSMEEIRRKLTIFHERTVPLLDFYRCRNVPIRTIKIERGISLDSVLAEVKCKTYSSDIFHHQVATHN